MNDATNPNQDTQARRDLYASLLEVMAAGKAVLQSMPIESIDFPTPSHVEVVVTILANIYKADQGAVSMGLGGNLDSERALVARVCHKLDAMKSRTGTLNPDK